MLGGLRTGPRAALLLPPDAPVAALAVDWPWNESRTLAGWQVVARLPAIREAVLRSPGVLALGAEAVAGAPDVDASRIVLLGASLGVPPALAALRLTRAPDALVLIDGAADLRALLAAGLARERCPPWLVAPAAALAFRLVRPLEPALNAEAAANLPVLVMNSDADPLLPRATIARLHDALPRADIRVRRGGHLSPRRLDVIAALATEVDEWLRSRVRP
jgi:pimeloyl-ACP methyl ester carboxylesterase